MATSGRPAGTLLAVEVDLAGVGPVHAVDQPQQLRAPGAHEPADTDDLARTDLEAALLHARRARHVADVEHDLVGRRASAGREQLVDLAADHLLHELAARRVGREAGGDGAPVGEDGHAVADARDLVEAMGDVDDADAVGRELADDTEQDLDLAVVEDRGRLVHDQQLHVARERAADRDHLLRGGTQVAHEHVRADVAVVEALEQRVRLGAHAGAIQETELARFVAEEDRLGDPQVLDQVELLVDRPDAEGHRLRRLTDRQQLAVDADLALGRGDHARHALDQGRLAGAVGAQQTVHLAGVDVEIHAFQRLDARVLLGDSPDLEQRLTISLHSRERTAT